MTITKEKIKLPMQFIDTHSHLYFEDFNADRDAVVERSVAAGVMRAVMPAVNSQTHAAMQETAARYPGYCRIAVGVHPTSINSNCKWRSELDTVRRLLQEDASRFCAVGEVGLDLHWDTSSISEQCQALAVQLQFALDHDLPVILHVRDAWNEIFPLLEPLAGRLRGVFHSFQGSLGDYRRIREMGGFAIGIGGYITYKNSAVVHTLQSVALEDIVLETDAPYLTPVPHRGQRNESSYIPLVAARIAEIKGVSVEHVAEVTTARAGALFF